MMRSRFLTVLAGFACLAMVAAVATIAAAKDIVIVASDKLVWLSDGLTAQDGACCRCRSKSATC